MKNSPLNLFFFLLSTAACVKNWLWLVYVQIIKVENKKKIKNKKFFFERTTSNEIYNILKGGGKLENQNRKHCSANGFDGFHLLCMFVCYAHKHTHTHQKL